MAGTSTSSQTLGFFPAVYEGELWHSVLSRYGFARGLPTARQVNRSLGNPSPVAPFDIPTSLDVLASSLPAELALTGENIATKHTLLPYYVAFARVHRKHAMLCGALGQGGRPNDNAGRRSGWLVRQKCFRYCEECVSEMSQRGQELHWIRQHQLALVTTCPRHGHLLLKGPSIGKRYYYIRATPENCRHDGEAIIEARDEVELEALREISRIAAQVLESATNGSIGDDAAGDLVSGRAFGAKLREMGYSRGQRLDMGAVGQNVRRILQLLTLTFPLIAEGASAAPVWFDHLIDGRTGEQTDSIVMGNYVLRRLVRRTSMVDVIGPAPWPCENVLASHHHQQVVNRFEGPWRASQGESRMRFYCDCGHVYTRALRADGSVTAPTTVRMGPLLRKFVEHAVSKGWSPTRMARDLGIRRKTLRNLCARESWDPP